MCESAQDKEEKDMNWKEGIFFTSYQYRKKLQGRERGRGLETEEGGSTDKAVEIRNADSLISAFYSWQL